MQYSFNWATLFESNCYILLFMDYELLQEFQFSLNPFN